jgi:tetratricopeptide (TPR) repeat protein
VTSRQALEVAGEHVYRLPSLDDSPARRLFADRAQAVDASFALVDDSNDAVAEVCRRLDGIPLAIELAAARVQVLTPRQIAERLNQRFRLLTSADAKVLPRHRTMTALLAWSYDLLNAREQRFFEALSVFAGGCTLETATEVCAEESEDDLDVVGLITSLVSKSLLIAEVSGDRHRYRLLESTRQYAAVKLVQRGSSEEFSRRHARAYLEVATTLEASLDSVSDEELFNNSQWERGNWHAALEWSLDSRHDIILGQRIVATDSAVLWDSATLFRGRKWVAKALELVDERTPPSLMADLELAGAAMASAFSESSPCLAAAERALSRYRSLGDEFGAARAARFAGHRLLIFERVAEGEALLSESLPTARRLRKPRLTAGLLYALSVASSRSNDFARARAYVAEALEITTAVGASRQAAQLLACLASIEYDAGDIEAAIRLTGDALEAERRLPRTTPSIAMTVTQMANFLVRTGRYDEAREHAAEALELAIDFRFSASVGLALQILAVQAVAGGRITQSKTLGSYAAKLCGFAEDQMAAFAIPKIYGLTDDYDRALDVLRDALGPEEVARLMAAGAALTEDEAIEEARALI